MKRSLSAAFARILVIAAVVVACAPTETFSQASPTAQAAPTSRPRLRDRLGQRLGRNNPAVQSLTPRSWTINGTERTALVHVPKIADGQKVPLIFVFHGHGGSGRQAAISFHLHTLWPEAMIVYPDGLPSKGMTDPEGRKAGWETQRNSDHARDLGFFDAMLADLKKQYPIDEKAIFVTGHSNGGSMTYLLWARRGEVFAGFAPSASIAAFMLPELKPRPALIIAGEADTIVPFAWQERNLGALKQLFRADGATTRPLQSATQYDTTPPLLTLVHPGGHQFAPAAPEVIVSFFQRLAREPETSRPGR